MIKLYIDSQKHGHVSRDFESQAEVDKYLFEIGNHWGRQKEEIAIVQREAQDDQGNIIEPQITEVLPQEVVFTTEDKTVEVEQEKQKKEKKKKDREDRVSSLKKIDWKAIKTIAELKDVVKSIHEELLKDEE